MVKLAHIAYVIHSENINILTTHSGKSLPININLSRIYDRLDQNNYFHVKGKMIIHLDALRGFQKTENDNFIQILLHPIIEDKILLLKKEFQLIEKWLQNSYKKTLL